jgi:choline-sulfatase
MREMRAGKNAPERALREIQATYYGMVSRVDSHIGRVLDSIRSLGLLQNSLVVFTVDHGDFAGQYGLIEKWDTAMNDCILHVPLIIHDPDLNRTTKVNSLSEHVDLAPTFLQIMGYTPDWGIHGESLVPHITEGKTKEAVFADGGHEEEMWGRLNREMPGNGKRRAKQETYVTCPETMSRTKMVRTDRYKLVVRLIGGNELYDLQSDPDEMKNLYGDPSYASIISDLQLTLIDWCLKTDTDRPFQEEVGA